MEVIQSYNQNAVIVLNNEGKEMVVVGKGIGFGKKPGDHIDDKKISKIFRYKYSAHEKNIIDSIAGISPDLILVSEKALEYAAKKLGRKLNPISIFALASHLDFAIQRETSDSNYNPLNYEIKYAYPEEFEVSRQLIDYFKEKHDIYLDQNETIYLTFHLVNAFANGEVKDVLQLGEILSSIMQTIESHLDYKLDQDSMDYSRFVLHLRYFLIKHFNNKPINDDFSDLYLDIFNKYPLASGMVESIEEMLLKNYQIGINNTEKLYILLHIERMLDNQE